MATVEVTSIPFSDKEYEKAIETLLNQKIDILAEKLANELSVEGYISLKNNLVINFTGTGRKRKFFLYDSNAEEQNPQNIKFDKQVAKKMDNSFDGEWPTEKQIEKIAETYHSDCFIFTENDRGNHTVLVKNEDNEWINDDWKNPAYPVPIYNIEGPTNSKSLLAFLLTKKLIPDFDDAKFDKDFSEICDIFKESVSIDDRRIVLSEKAIKDLKSNVDWNDRIEKQLLKGMGIENAESGFTAEDVKDALLKCDFRRAEIPPYEQSYVTDPTQWFWDLYPKDYDCQVSIPEGIKIRARDPNDDVKDSITGRQNLLQPDVQSALRRSHHWSL